MKNKYKTKTFEVSADYDDDYQFKGYASTFGNEDRSGDIIASSAFDNIYDKSYPLLFNHDVNSVIGKIVATPDDKGLLVKGYLNLNDSKANNVYELLKMEALNSMSIGFIAKQFEPIDTGYLIKDIDLLEVSVVTVPANDKAMVAAVKSFENETNENLYSLIKKAVREVFNERDIINKIKNLKG